MTLTTAPPRRDDPPAPPGPRLARRPAVLPWLLAAGTAAQVAVRLWFARARTAPAANPDETGYLTAARWLAGSAGGELSGNTFYQGGYPLLLAPAYWLSHDPATVYTIVMVINALLGAALFPLGYAAARRLGLARSLALPVAFAAALLPATTFFGAFALADAVLPALALAWLLSLDRFVRKGRALDAAAASAVASYAAMVHTRGMVFLVVHVLVLVGVAVTHRLRDRAAVAGGAVALAGYAAGASLNTRVKGELYPGGTRDLAASLELRITTVPGQEWALSGAAGQIWYLVVSTWGLAGVGLAAVAVVLVRRRTPGPDRIMAAALLAATFAVAYASSAALPDEHRVGNFAYGRYLSCLALVYTLIGVTALMRSGPRAAIRLAAASLLVLGGAALWVAAYAGGRLRTHTFIAFDFPETTFLTGDRSALHLPAVTLIVSALLCGFLALSRLGGRRGALVTAVALAGINLAALTFAMGPSPRRVPPPAPFPGPAAGGVVADVSLHWAVRISLMHPVWWTRVGRVDLRDGRRPAPGVCTVVVPQPDETDPEASWPAHPAGWRPHAGRTWSIRWVSWHAPSCDAAPR
ncbi:hypothetical protein ETD83_07020 [Actinomadura soli]|uniref:4-amino-4-deoxy-L-arabinose transferase-like glycosyltransferase n=1 Tax=Actinomadura soli TaxID=2508997 RepID=A0A5C4JGV1_9ACTN|nr:hypothetical protein [Actinomadura soli]TMR05044.1 hypothetical protein ETD83_07020 [Actinomadura soli]